VASKKTKQTIDDVYSIKIILVTAQAYFDYQEISSAVGTRSSGESLRLSSKSFEIAGDDHPNFVPHPKLARLTNFLMIFCKFFVKIV
jgi:hypothetical protein